MSTPLVTIITATYNRAKMFSECAEAVLAQTFADWQWWVALNFDVGDRLSVLDYQMATAAWKDYRVLPIYFPCNKEARAAYHVPAQIVNWLYPKVTTPYIYWLSDDDLIDPDGLGLLVSAAQPIVRAMTRDELGPFGGSGMTLEKDRYDAVYGRCEVVDQRPDGTYAHGSWCYDDGDVGLGTGIDPHCRLDGGQVLHTADLWRRATADGWQLTDSKADAAANDGTLLRRLAEFARFHYVPARIVTHRRHAGATYHKPQVNP